MTRSMDARYAPNGPYGSSPYTGNIPRINGQTEKSLRSRRGCRSGVAGALGMDDMKSKKPGTRSGPHASLLLDLLLRYVQMSCVNTLQERFWRPVQYYCGHQTYPRERSSTNAERGSSELTANRMSHRHSYSNLECVEDAQLAFLVAKVT